MPKYGDDQCEECGAARASGLRLCVGCLVKAHDRERRKKEMLQLLVNDRDLEVKRLKIMLEGALYYGFKQNKENDRLKQHIIEIQREIERGVKNGKDRQAEDTGL